MESCISPSIRFPELLVLLGKVLSLRAREWPIMPNYHANSTHMEPQERFEPWAQWCAVVMLTTAPPHTTSYYRSYRDSQIKYLFKLKILLSITLLRICWVLDFFYFLKLQNLLSVCLCFKIQGYNLYTCMNILNTKPFMQSRFLTPLCK